METSVESPETPKVATTTTVAEHEPALSENSQETTNAINSLVKDNEMLPKVRAQQQPQHENGKDCPVDLRSERSDQLSQDETHTDMCTDNDDTNTDCDSGSVMCTDASHTADNELDRKTLPTLNSTDDNHNINTGDDAASKLPIKLDCHSQEQTLVDCKKPDISNTEDDHSTEDVEKDAAADDQSNVNTVPTSVEQPTVSEQTLDQQNKQTLPDESSDQPEMASKQFTEPNNTSPSLCEDDDKHAQEILEGLEDKSEMLFKKCQQKEDNAQACAEPEPGESQPTNNDHESSLNPFGDFDSEEEENIKPPERAKSPEKPVPPAKPANLMPKSPIPAQSSPKVQYPKDFNPFGDDEEDAEQEEEDVSKSHNDSLNPFGEFDSDTEEVPQIQSPARPSPTPTPRTSLGTPNRLTTPVPPVTKSSPHSLRKSPKKARAPLPPTMNQSPKITPNTPDDQTSITSRTPTPTPRKSKTSEGQQDNHSPNVESVKTKKRSAPPIPAVKREVKTVSIEEIEKELDEIGDKLPELEKQRIELEQFLLSTQKALEKEAENDEEYKKKKVEFIDIAKNKCKLSQRQKELMYKKSEAKLEKQQMDIEYRLRTIMSKQDALKTEEDRSLEQEILKELMEVVENRNDIIENTIRDENKEIEEYIRIIEKVFPDEAVTLTPSGLNGSKSDLRPSKSMSTSKLLKKKTMTTLTTLKLKKKKNKDDKHGGKDIIPEQANNSGKVADNQQDQATAEKDMTNQKSILNDSAEKKKKSHFSLGKSTLKKFTSKGKLSAGKESDEQQKDEVNTSDNTA